MQEKESAIILRKFSTTQHKVSVLSNSLGKIALVVLHQQPLHRLQLGSLIQFSNPEQSNNIFTTTNLSIYATPIPRDVQDLIWLHHLLELCYYFIPLHQPSQECYLTLHSSISLLDHANLFLVDEWERLKKLCLGVLLLFLGFFPPRHLERSIIAAKNVLLAPTGPIDQEKIALLYDPLQNFIKNSCTGLDEWLVECIQSHPRVNAFKTVHLMYQLP